MPSKKNKEYIERGERKRLSEIAEESFFPSWSKWGPYVSERAWGTVREDYSSNGDAWNYFPFDQAHTKAYRWGEDGIAGISDRYQLLVFAPVFWNGKDPILKERLFGLSSKEGNHGEDVKEYYFHLDATPTHSYMKYLYKYPQQRFPYEQVKEENKKRSPFDPEFELIDTGVFQDNEYFDIFIEYAKASSEDILIKIEVFNRYHLPAPIHILPHLWFRNRWSWGSEEQIKPDISLESDHSHLFCVCASDEMSEKLSNLPFDYQLGKRYLYGPKGNAILFTENESPVADIQSNRFKDAFHQAIIQGRKTELSFQGSKSCFYYYYPEVQPHKSVQLYLRLSDKKLSNPLKDVEEVFKKRIKESEQFFSSLHPKGASEEEKMIQKQALSGLIWNKQIYLFDVSLWLDGDNKSHPPSPSRLHIRNQHWRHLNSMRILSMPDKWEYPWFAAWDLAFQSISWGLVDINFAKEQIWLLLFDQFQHPNGQIPAYEWEFSDLNPPIQAWAVLKLFNMESERLERKDYIFLEKCFHKLLMNFSWWVNKVDSSGNNVFEGGFLGLDNIAVLDRSIKLPHGISLQQSDGTGWMAFFCLNLMKMSLELSSINPVYTSLATKFFEHYIYIAHAMKKRGDKDYGLWSEKDGFFYDVLTYPDGSFEEFRVRSLVGIIPLFAVECFSEKEIKKYSDFYQNFLWFMRNRPDLVDNCVIPIEKEGEKHFILTPMNQHQMTRIIHYVWDPGEFRSHFGLRSLSKYHHLNPFEFEGNKVLYEPAESCEKIKGGNSNWRGPIWMPINYLLIESIRKLSQVFNTEFKIKIEGENEMNLEQIADSFANRVLSIFKRDEENVRPFFGKNFPLAKDPHWENYLSFHEYFNAETGKGLGASHQCGWTALIANIIDELHHKTT
ncbi:MAG: glucosidase [Chlamydiae bacterium]|nr:glucosidase [Chlamydiota bacterium]